MSDAKAFGFGQFIPGYDFLQQLNKASQGAALPPFSSWVAPTVSVEEIDKRIDELKAVQFWLEQNGKALAATVQALQVQKMTLSTLKGMNVNLQEFAQTFGPSASASASSLSNWPMGAAQKQAPSSSPQPPKAQPAPAEAPAAAAHPMAEQAQQWWGALTQQFQQIAHQVLQDPAQKNAMAQAASMASDFTKVAAQTASDMMRQAVGQATTAAQAATQAATAAATVAKKPAATAAKKPATAKKTAAADATAKPATETAAKPAAPKTRSVKKA